MSKGYFSAHKEKQLKVVLNKQDINALDKALQGTAPIPTLQKIFDNKDKVMHLDNERKLGKSILQIAFIVTIGKNSILLKRRNNRDTILNKKTPSSAPEEKYSILTSSLCSSAPATEEELLQVFHDKVPTRVFRNKLPESIQFLGIIRNKVESKQKAGEFVTYYFYIHELNYQKKGFPNTKSINSKLEQAVKKDANELFSDPFPLDESTSSLIHCNYHADIAAYQLLRQFRLRESMAASTIWCEALHHSSIYDIAKTLFIIHDHDDYEMLAKPLLHELNENKIPYWIEEEHAHLGTIWRLTNAQVERYARGIICIESKRSICSENVFKEIKVALHVRSLNPRYKIIRLQSDDISDSEEKAFRQSLKNAGVNDSKLGLYFNISATHFQGSSFAPITHKLPR